MGFFIFVLILVLLPLVWPYIARAIKRYMMGKFEDRMRRMMGMPTRAEEKKARRRRENDSPYAAAAGGNSRRRGRGRSHDVGDPAADLRMMRSYAEDVEFTEIKEYSEEIRFSGDKEGKRENIKMEEQVSDVEFVVINSPS